MKVKFECTSVLTHDDGTTEIDFKPVFGITVEDNKDYKDLLSYSTESMVITFKKEAHAHRFFKQRKQYVLTFEVPVVLPQEEDSYGAYMASES